MFKNIGPENELNNVFFSDGAYIHLESYNYRQNYIDTSSPEIHFFSKTPANIQKLKEKIW